MLPFWISEKSKVKLSDWVFNAIRAQEVLTLHPDYFRLRKPLERRVYELVRKHCGQQPSWTISLEKLLKKSGSQSPMKRFKQMISGLAEHNHLPDYRVELNGDNVTFVNRHAKPRQIQFAFPDTPTLKESTLETAKKTAPGYDIYALQQEWLEHWVASGKPAFEKSPDAAFIGFCKKRALRNKSA